MGGALKNDYEQQPSAGQRPEMAIHELMGDTPENFSKLLGKTFKGCKGPILVQWDKLIQSLTNLGWALFLGLEMLQ